MRRFAARIVLLSLAAAVGGCDGGPPAPTDGGVPDDAPSLAPPAPFALTCPAGWRSRELHGARICEPWATDEAPRCAEDELPVLGQPAGAECQPVWPCPSGPWPDDAPADAVFLRPDATGGDGSRDAPFGVGDLSSALAAARTRRVALVVGEGEIPTGFDVASIPAVIGLCPSRSRIRSMGVTLGVSRGTTEITGLSLESLDYLGMEVGRGATVRLRGVVSRGAVNGLRVDERGVVEGDRVSLRGSTTVMPRAFVSAIEAGEAARIELHHSLITGAGGGISTFAPAVRVQVTFEDGAILDASYGMLGGIDGTFRRVAMERVAVGAIVTSGGASTWEDARIRLVGEVPYDGWSVGLVAVDGSLTLRRVAMSEIRGYAAATLSSEGASATLAAEDLFVSDTGAVLAPAVTDRIALLVWGAGASALLERGYFAQIFGTALQVERGALRGTDLHVLDTRADGPTWGNAIQAYQARLDLARVTTRAELRGLLVGDDTLASVSDLTVEGGLGVHVQCRGDCTDASTALTLTRAAIHDVGRIALVVADATAQLDDVEIGRIAPPTSPIEADELPGVGLAVAGGVVRGRAVSIDDVPGIGLLAYDGAAVSLDAVTVRDLHAVDCVCGPNAYGDGVLWAAGATVELGGLAVERAQRGGLVAALDFGPFVLSGVVRRSGIGIITDPRTPADLAAFGRLELVDNDLPSLPVEITIGESESSPWRYAPASNADPSRIGF